MHRFHTRHFGGVCGEAAFMKGNQSIFHDTVNITVAATISNQHQYCWRSSYFKSRKLCYVKTFVFYLDSLTFRIFEPEEYLFVDVWWWPTSLGWNAWQGIPCYYLLSVVYRFFHLPPVSTVTLDVVSLFEGLGGV